MSARPQIGGAPGTGDKRKKRQDLEDGEEGQNRKDEAYVLDGWTSFLVSVRGRTEGTAKRYRRLVERLLADVGKPIAQLGREDIEKHLRRLHVAGRGESVRQEVVVAVRSLGEWCLAHGIVEVNPGAGLAGPRPYRREIKMAGGSGGEGSPQALAYRVCPRLRRVEPDLPDEAPAYLSPSAPPGGPPQKAGSGFFPAPGWESSAPADRSASANVRNRSSPSTASDRTAGLFGFL